MEPNHLNSKNRASLDYLVGDFEPQIGQGMNVPAGRYRYVKINLRNDWSIITGQVMFLNDPNTWEVTGKNNGFNPRPSIGLALRDIRYHWWEYVLYILTRRIRFSPVRYIYIQEAYNGPQSEPAV